jgi:hypothetical protein
VHLAGLYYATTASSLLHEGIYSQKAGGHVICFHNNERGQQPFEVVSIFVTHIKQSIWQLANSSSALP